MPSAHFSTNQISTGLLHHQWLKMCINFEFCCTAVQQYHGTMERNLMIYSNVQNSLLGTIKVSGQTLPEINVHAPLFGTLE